MSVIPAFLKSFFVAFTLPVELACTKTSAISLLFSFSVFHKALGHAHVSREEENPYELLLTAETKKPDDQGGVKCLCSKY